MKSFKEEHPKDIVTRCLILERLRTVPPKLILQLPNEFHKFVKGKDSVLFGSKGESQSNLSFDWECVLFEAKQDDLLEIFSFLQKKPKEEKNEEIRE